MLAGVALTMGAGDLSAQKSEQPNILMIAVDDLKPILGCYGDTLIHTPNIDSLAAYGLTFTRSYCQQAVCAPSRASLLTGRYPDQTKVLDLQTMMREVSPEITSWPEYFITQGYTTAATGKLFDFRSVDDELDLPSWSIPYRKHYDAKYYDPVNGKPSFYYASPESKDTIAKLKAEAAALGLDQNAYVKSHYFPSVEMADVGYDGYVDGAIANVGIELLEEVAGQTAPFFLSIGFHRPHLPFVAPKQFWDLYERSDFEVAPFREHAANSPDIAYHNYDELRAYTDIPGSGDMEDAQQLELIHGYYAAVSYVDYLVGMVMTRLEELDLDENTIIILWGDNGWHLGDHNLWCKHSNFEEATRVPLIISYPGQPNAGEVTDSPVEFTDIPTTICELTNVELPVYFEGESLVPLFQNPDTTVRPGALSQYPRYIGMGYSLRTERYRYTKWVNTNGTEHSRELYDYDTDPLETISQVYNPDYAAIVHELDSIVQRRIEIPSTQDRIQFRIRGKDGSDTIDLEDIEVLFHGEVQTTSEDGMVIFTHTPGSYSYEVDPKGYTSTEESVDVEGDTIITLTLEKEYYHVTFQVEGQWNGLPIPGADVIFTAGSQVTDDSGEVDFNSVPYANYQVRVDFFGDQSQMFNNIEITSDTTIVLELTQPLYTVEVYVIDHTTDNGVQVALVSFDANGRTTSSEGYTSFNLIEGSYLLGIEHDYFSSVSESVNISSDTVLRYYLDPTHADVKIWLKEDDSPVSDATVIVGEEEIITLGLGLAKFLNLPNDQSYDYSIEKGGYNKIEGSLFLTLDTTFTLEMTLVGLDEFLIEAIEITVWPNPVNEILTIRKKFADKGGQVQIIAGNGAVLYTGSFDQEQIEINMAPYAEGEYFIQYINDRSIYTSGVTIIRK